MAKTPGEQYLETIGGLTPPPAATMADYQAEANRLSFLAPAPQRQSIYDLASDLSAGLAAQAASGQPASIGYGLTAGFNTFSEGAALRRRERDKYKQQIMMMAYESVEKKRAEQKALQEQAANYDFEIAIEQAKNSGTGIFGGLNSTEGRALDFLARLRANPNLAITNKAEFEAAKAFLGSKFKTVTIDGQVQAVPVYDVDKLFPESKTPKPVVIPPAVGTVTDGYRFKGGDPNVQENWEKVDG